MLKPKFPGTRMIRALACSLALLVLLSIPANAAGLRATDSLRSRQAARIYASPDSASQVIGLLENGSALTVLARFSGFYRIDCYGQVCYIAAEQVEQRQSSKYYVNCSGDSPDTLLLQTRNVLELELLRKKILNLALAQEGTPYVFGGESPGGFDCSGLIYYVYQAAGYGITRTAFTQLAESTIVDPESMKPGDLVFFNGTDGSDDFVTHVGLYLGGELFIHAGSLGGICIRSLAEDYYAQRFVCARRLLHPGPFTMPLRHPIALN